jgi:hypothetical protein
MSNKIIDKINVVAFDVNCVSGTISREASSDANIFTPGAVRYMDTAHLRVFTSARQAANRLCRSKGVRFLSGWAIPDESVDGLVSDLNDIANKVNIEKTILLSNWNENIRHWIDLNPQVDSYRGRFPSKEHAEKQIGASLSVFRINSVAVKSSAADGVQTEVKGLAGRVLNEIAQDVADTWKPGATQASQRIKNLLLRLENKCRTLEFLGGNLSAVAKFIDQGIHALPTQGAITGVDFMVLSGLLAILSSPEKMMSLSSDIIDARQMLIGSSATSQNVVEVANDVTQPVAVPVIIEPVSHVTVPDYAEFEELPAKTHEAVNDEEPAIKVVPESTPAAVSGDAWNW